MVSTAVPVVPRLTVRARKAVTVWHVASSVALLGQLWVNAVLAVVAMRAPSDGRGVYQLMQALVFASAIPLSLSSLVSGVILGLGTKWGVLRYRWVAAKLGLLLLTVLIGSTIQGPLLDQLIVAPSPVARGANLTTTGVQLVLLVVATWLSVFKPGGRIRQRAHP